MTSKSDVLILAGGFGTRMSSEFPSTPKPLIPVLGIPILERLIIECKKYGLTKICILLHFEAKQIMDYLEDGSKFGVNIIYSIEKTPLGTGGALMSSLDSMSSSFLVLYADVFSDVNLKKLFNYHNKKNSEVTVVAHPNSHPHDSDLLILDKSKRVLEVSPHPHVSKSLTRNMVSAAMYIFDKSTLLNNKLKIKKFDIAQHLLPKLITNGSRINAYVTIEYLKDMGTPDRLYQVEKDINLGVPDSRSQRHSRKCIFFDRDGTLNHDVGHLNNSDDLKLLPRVAKAISNVNSSGYIAICTTNQPVIARGSLTEEGLEEITSKLEFELGLGGAYLDSLYYCPHHPDSGFEGEVTNLKIECECRKPKPGMFKAAAFEHNINLTKSWVVGDRTADLRAAYNIGARSILVSTGSRGFDDQYPTRSHFYAADIEEAVDFILNKVQKLEDFFSKILPFIEKKRFIYIVGPSRAGKSTFTNNLKWYLNQKGIISHILELDAYLKPNRSESQFYIERYDHKSINAEKNLFLSNNPINFTDRGFDNLRNKVLNYGEENIEKKSICLIEGIPAGHFQSANTSNSLKIFIDCNKEIRKKRFVNKYIQDGRSIDEIQHLWEKRIENEDSYVYDQIDSSDYTFNSDIISGEEI